MDIGSVIRAKRRQKDLTQEQLAEYLNVSVSSVSQWENGKTAPDLAMLEPIAEFFGISLDELFGRQPDEKEKALAEYDERGGRLAAAGDTDGEIDLWREALRRFPGDFGCMENLATSLFLRICADHDAEGVEEMAKECASMCERILRDCTDSVIRGGAVQTLVLLYSSSFLSIANEEKAIGYACMAVSAWQCRESLLESAYFTEESRDKRLNIMHANRLYYMDRLAASLIYGCDIRDGERLSALETALRIYELIICDGNYLFYHCRIADIFSYIAMMHAGRQRVGETLEAVKKALYHARAYDTLPAEEQRYTSVFLRCASSDPSRCSKNYTETHTKVVMDRFKNHEFDFIRENREFLDAVSAYEA